MKINLSEGERIEITLPNGNKVVIEESTDAVKATNRNVSVYHSFIEDGQIVEMDCLLDADYTP